MKLKNIALSLGLAGLGLIVSSSKVQAIDWNFNYSYTDFNEQIWNGEGTLSYDENVSSYSNFNYLVSSLSFTENSGNTTKNYSLEDSVELFVEINSIGDISYFRLVGRNPIYSDFDYGRYLQGSPGSNNSAIYTYNSDGNSDGLYPNSVTFSPATAVPFDFSPSQGIALGLPLFIGLRMLKKRRALKKSNLEIQEMIRS